MRLIALITLSFVATNIIANDALWQQLQKEPNMVVFMRNAESTGNRDGSNMLVWDANGNCAGESTLTEKGKEQARQIGASFKTKNLVPQVISSPMCRCKQTAEIAFGDFVTAPELIQASIGDIEKQEDFQAKATELLVKHRGLKPIVFVNHRPNIDSLTMEMLSLGELLVGAIMDDGEIEVLGKIIISQ
jgi:phosphohistidine phosphatase SixA